jgi:hypothetical protein
MLRKFILVAVATWRDCQFILIALHRYAVSSAIQSLIYSTCKERNNTWNFSAVFKAVENKLCQAGIPEEFADETAFCEMKQHHIG